VILQHDVLEELHVPIKIIYGIANCFIILRRLLPKKVCRSFQN